MHETHILEGFWQQRYSAGPLSVQEPTVRFHFRQPKLLRTYTPLGGCACAKPYQLHGASQKCSRCMEIKNRKTDVAIQVEPNKKY